MTRFNTAKLAMATFIASEAVFFGFLIAAYIYFYGATVHGPNASNSLNPPRTLIFTILLLASSGTMHMAERSLRAQGRGFQAWLAATILLGFVFICGQIAEWGDLLSKKNLTPARNLFGATFFTLTGFHGFHVLCGLMALSAMLILTLRGPFGGREKSGIAAVTMYWHFVDVVWIVIFSMVYLTVWL